MCKKYNLLRDKLHKLAISNNEAHHWSNYRKKRVKNLVKSAKDEFFKKLIEEQKQPKANLDTNKKDPTQKEDPK